MHKEWCSKKVFSLDIEKALLQNPCVENCAVVPINDKKINQVPVAYIIKNKNYADTTLCEKELREFCDRNLEDVYRPVGYIFVDSFPHTKVGKVDYLTLEKSAEKK